ncbi:MAG: hypothetical protein SNJ72_02290 [Fimbriimonadales bacterium]
MRCFFSLAGMLTFWAGLFAQIGMHALKEIEPNNSLSAPQVISEPVNQRKGFVVWDGTIRTTADRDFYRFQITEQGTYSIRVDTNRDTVLNLYSATGALISSNNNNGNPDIPNLQASGITLTLAPGVYVVEVLYFSDLSLCRYALRVFPGTVAPDFNPNEPNDTEAQAISLGEFNAGERVTSDYQFLTYDGRDVDVYAIQVYGTASRMRFRLETYVEVDLQVRTPSGEILTGVPTNWDPLNPDSPEIVIPVAPSGVYFFTVRSRTRWGGYYRVSISAEVPNELGLQSGNARFVLRMLWGQDAQDPFNNADWIQPSSVDHFYLMNHWFRVEGVNNRERPLSNLFLAELASPNRKYLLYREEDIVFGTIYELRALSDTSSVLFVDIFVWNTRLTPTVLHVYHYFDPDVSDQPYNYAEQVGERIRISRGTNRVELAPITPPNFWEIALYPDTYESLFDDQPTNLSNGTLPLEGDITGALQWRLELNPFAWRTVRLYYTLNSDFVVRPSDVNRDGCVDDADLLEVLFAFGTEGFLNPADIDANGIVDDADLLEVLFHFGAGC